MGLADAAESDQSAIGRLVEALKALNADLEVPTPADFGIARDRFHALIPTMAEQALASGSPANNPRVPEKAEIEALFRQIYP
jgi:alcohol dehydrogenase class IV